MPTALNPPPHFAPATRYGVPFVHRAEAYVGEGYKGLARQYGVEPERLAVDTSTLERPTVRWDAPTQSVITTDPQQFSNMLERQGIAPQRYAELGASLKVETPNGLKNAAESLADFGKKAGPVASVIVGTLAGAFTLAAGGSKAEAAQVVYEAAVLYGETQIDLARGDLLATEKSATIETASNLGSLGGAAAGAAIGTMILPGVGTAIGAGIGALGGGVGTDYLTEKIHDNYAQIKSGAVQLADETAESLTNTVQKMKQFLAGWFDRKPALNAQAAFNALPNSVTPDMPPEVAALIEVKASQKLFEKNFAEIERHGGLPEVQAYIKDHPQNAGHKAFVSEERSIHYSHLPMPGLR